MKIISINFWKIRQNICNSTGIKKKYNIFLYKKLMQKYNCFIPWRTNIKGQPHFPHGISGVFISKNAIIGENCTIFHQVTIGSNSFDDSKQSGSPQIGDNVFIGAGAKIIGGIRVGNNVRIGAGCVVAQDIPDNATVVMPKPRIIAHENILDNRYKII